MELRQLRYFITVVNEGTISLAARRLHLSQPPLSHQMKLLEEELGVTLFERGSRHIRLTLPGKAFYERALAILDLSELAKSEIVSLDQEIAGTIKLGIISSAAEFITSRFLAPFQKESPQVTLEVSESNTFHLLELLHMNQIDLAIVRTPFSRRALDCIALPPDPFIAAARPPYLEAADRTGESGTDGAPVNAETLSGSGGTPANAETLSGSGGAPADTETLSGSGGAPADTETLSGSGGAPPGLSLAQFAASPLILYRRWEPLILNYFDEIAVQPRIACVTDDARTAILWAREGAGIALVPRSALYLTRDPQLVCREITAPRLSSSICLVRRQEKIVSLAAAAFYERFLRFRGELSGS